MLRTDRKEMRTLNAQSWVEQELRVPVSYPHDYLFVSLRAHLPPVRTIRVESHPQHEVHVIKALPKQAASPLCMVLSKPVAQVDVHSIGVIVVFNEYIRPALVYSF